MPTASDVGAVPSGFTTYDWFLLRERPMPSVATAVSVTLWPSFEAGMTSGVSMSTAPESEARRASSTPSSNSTSDTIPSGSLAAADALLTHGSTRSSLGKAYGSLGPTLSPVMVSAVSVTASRPAASMSFASSLPTNGVVSSGACTVMTWLAPMLVLANCSVPMDRVRVAGNTVSALGVTATDQWAPERTVAGDEMFSVGAALAGAVTRVARMGLAATR